jgi:Family of unknown function (DUF6338)
VVPSTWISILFFFFFLVAPGATFVLLSRRRRATFEESAFLEISRIVLASLVFSGIALAVLIVVHDFWPHWLPEPRRLVAKDGTDYVRDRYALVTRTVVIGIALACAAAFLATWALGKLQGGATISPVNAWTQVFKLDCPANHDAYVRVRLADGVVYSGLVANFSSDLEVEGRELVLAPPLASKTSDATGLRPVPPEYQRVVLRGDSIEVMSVEYRPRSTTARSRVESGRSRSPRRT